MLRDNPRIVAKVSGAPLLGEVPHLPDPDRPGDAFEEVGRAFLSRWEEARDG